MESEIVTNGLLAIIAALGTLCTWFMSRMVNKFDQLESCVEQLSVDLTVFKVKIAAIFNLTEDLDEIPAPKRK
jgi:phosphoglycerate-specific signal transduction histidine kinase